MGNNRFLSGAAWKTFAESSKDAALAALAKPSSPLSKAIAAYDKFENLDKIDTAAKVSALIEVLDEVDEQAREVRKQFSKQPAVAKFADGLLKEAAAEAQAARKKEEELGKAADAASAALTALDTSARAACQRWNEEVAKALRSAAAEAEKLTAGLKVELKNLGFPADADPDEARKTVERLSAFVQQKCGSQSVEITLSLGSAPGGKVPANLDAGHTVLLTLNR